MDRLITADARTINAYDFFCAVTGTTPRTREEREAGRRAYFAKLREENRRELEEVRDRLCEEAGPELAARFRARWAEEDERDERRWAA